MKVFFCDIVIHNKKIIAVQICFCVLKWLLPSLAAQKYYSEEVETSPSAVWCSFRLQQPSKVWWGASPRILYKKSFISTSICCMWGLIQAVELLLSNNIIACRWFTAIIYRKKSLPQSFERYVLPFYTLDTTLNISSSLSWLQLVSFHNFRCSATWPGTTLCYVYDK